MGCGSSKGATDVAQPAAQGAAVPWEKGGAAPEPLGENVTTVPSSFAAPLVPVAEKDQPKKVLVKKKESPQAPAPKITSDFEDPHIPALDDHSEQEAWSDPAETAVRALPSAAAPVSKGFVMDKIDAILDKDDDDFQEDVIGAAEKLLVQPSGNQDTATFIMQGKASQGGRNPLSDSLAGMDTPADSPMPLKPEKAPALQAEKSQNHFSDISNGPSALPNVQRASQPGAWSMPSGLDALMDTPEDAGGARMTRQQKAGHPQDQVLDFTQDDLEGEEEDSFNVMAIAAPKFDPTPEPHYEPKFEPKPRAGRGKQSADFDLPALGDEPEYSEPADPWDMLQDQYRIRDEMRSPETSGAGRKHVVHGQLDPNEELILDEFEGNNVAPARKNKKPESKLKPFTSDLPPRKGGAIEAKWGEGEMAQAGDLMLGRGALDFDYDPGFSGYGGGLSNFSAPSYNEYRGNEGSMDMETLEVPRLDADGLDMEDFHEEMETYGIIKPKGKPSLEDKLRMFEQMDDDLDDDDLLLQEELRLASAQEY